ncbi:PREDICTED: 2-amino-3-ketobutyrate coenzyme A ligase, mitochondrial-like [Priapulus caudatus]|uniref:2-amino-3-ketobutyrate coenzyme A ligase, mitochondrial-like n=1 Tax=Priapulus caudatus TaxID=37621 RepID=A0ABM1E168_PRICU|nr:PREDICTED: 2-amino-3-ketobutyrate coenzyme A ligase, mitochondrial-like [Priapulus caudatus]
MAVFCFGTLRHFQALSSLKVQFPRAFKRHTATQAAVKQILQDELAGIKKAGTWKPERVITSRQGVEINVQGSNATILNFCANNYLGLSSHPDVIEAGKAALDSHGAGMSSVRFICGTQDLHKELEAKIALFHSREEAILYPSCFDANTGLFEVLLGPDDAVLSDALNHASVIDGIRLCKAKRLRYKHRDMADLERQLRDVQSSRMRVIATDGVFSMDGNVTPLKRICDLADEYCAIVFIDEAHSTGFFGPTGRGTEEHLGISGRVDLINSTLGKALGGGSGGYTTGPKEVIDLLRQRSRPYLFSNSVPPPVVAAAIKVFDMLLESSELAGKVHDLTMRFRNNMKAAGFTVGGDEHPICPVMLGDAHLANVYAEKMLEKGIYVIGFSYPVVPQGEARIRVQISAAHTNEEIDKTVDAFVAIGKELGVI